ncbi:hypothetical protein F5877DRAFT_76581 [Lentinula edodes]|nr:hypothetical protein F5877DRAFT_76581 [Lentinula edodes]
MNLVIQSIPPMLHIPPSASSSTSPGSHFFTTGTHMGRVVEESARPRYLLNEPPNSNREERQRRPILSLYIPQTTHDSGFEENRTPRPRSARLVRSVRSGHRVAESSQVSPALQNHRLPVEILTDIFLYCLLTIHDVPPPRLTDQAPLLLVAVCREWRLIVLNTPRLWSSPHFRIPPPASMNSMSLKRQLDGIDLWLRRSGSTIPITVSLMPYRGLKHSDSGCREEVHPNTLKLIQSLMCHSHRITRLGILSFQTMHHLLRSLSIMGTIQLPALKSIYVRLAAQHRSLMSEEVLADLMSHSHKSMPVLQELHIDGLTSSAAGHLIRTPNWSSNITHLILGPSSSSRRRSGFGSFNGHDLGPCDALSILSQNPQLQSFEATVTLHTHRSCTSFANLPFLLNLIIYFEVPPNDALISYPDQDMYRFFEYISCPALRALSVAYAGIPSLTEIPFLSWLNTSFNEVSESGRKRTMRVDKLRDLKLEVSMTPEALTECLILLPPSVRMLEIVDLGHIDVEGVGVVEFGHTVQDSHLELLTWQISTPNSVDESVKDVDVSCCSHSSSLAASVSISDSERGHEICPRLKTFRLVISGFLTLLCSTPTSRSSSTSSLRSPRQSPSDWRRRRSGVSRAALQRFIESRKQTGLQSSGPFNFRKKLLRECEVLLSPALSGSYLLDSPGL